MCSGAPGNPGIDGSVQLKGYQGPPGTPGNMGLRGPPGKTITKYSGTY